MRKRVLSLMLTLFMLLALVPAVTPTADAAAAGTVYADTAQKNLDKLISALNGKYFTVDQKACKNPGEGSHGCSNCGMINVIKESWLKTAVGRVPSSTSSGFQHYYYGKTLTRGQSCCGFANFAGWYIFSSKSSDTVTFSQYKTGSFNSSTMASAKPGDVLRFGSSTSSNSHSAVFISTYSDGIYVLDSNWSYSGGNCKVSKHKIAYSKYKYVTISRANNYEANKNSTYEAELYNNYSGKNYLPAVSAENFSTDTYWSRDTSVATVTADSSVRRVSSCDTLKIVNTSAGKSGTDLVFKTTSSDTTKNGAYSLGDQSMILSFWAKSSVAGTKMYFRWGYESDYRSITLTTDWKYYTVNMDKTSSFGECIHPYADAVGTVWLSELQLEEGSSATSFAAETGGIYGTITSKTGGKYSGLTTPTRNGYSFDGWYTKAVGGTQITKDSSTLAGDVKLYAHWTKNHTHSYTAVTKDPTCTNQGYTTYTCSCGDTYTNYTSALGHDYINGVCSRCNAKLSSGFTDVKAGAYCFDAVKWAVTNNVTNGIGGGLFDPDGSCTRAQIVTFLWRANGSPEVSSMAVFSDVKEEEYYYDAVRWAVTNGITNGVGNGLFDPEGECSRSQIVTFLWRANGSPAVGGTVTFPDIKQGEYYYDAVRWAVANGITNGSDGGKFGVNDTCTRGQAVTFLYRTYGI